MVNQIKSVRALWGQDTKAIIWLALPLILTNFAHVAMTTVDILFLGTLGITEIAAGGLAIALFNQFRTTGTGLVTSVSNLVAEANTRQDRNLIQSLLVSGFFWATAVALLFILIIILLEKPLIWLGQDAQIAKLTVHFLQIVAPGLLPCLWFQTLRHFTVGLKYPGPLLLITIISIALTIVFNYVLVFGKFGFSSMGLSGIALSTAIIFLLSFLMFLVVVLRHPKLAGYFNFSKFKFDRSTLKTVWKLGLPIAATYASEAGFFTILTLLIGTLGVNALAAQTVINQIIYIVFMISAGISHAASILISESYSAQNYAHVRRLGHLAVIISSACMAVIAIIYLLFPKQIIALFISGQYALQPVMMRLMITGLAIAALLQFFDAIQNIGNGILRGIGDTVTPFKLSIVGYWLIGLPAAYLLSKVFYFGVYGVWFGLTIGLTVTALLLLYFFYKRLNTLQHITSVDVTTVNKTNF